MNWIRGDFVKLKFGDVFEFCFFLGNPDICVKRNSVQGVEDLYFGSPLSVPFHLFDLELSGICTNPDSDTLCIIFYVK